MVSICLNNLGIRFRVRQCGRVTLKEFLVRALFRKSVNPIIEVKALNGIDLELKEGERVGIIGHNGAGKSTFLKMIAGIYPPTSGTLAVTGRINSMLDLGIGLETEVSGWENIFYRGLLQGDTPKQIRAKMKEIAEFSELGSALDMPVRFYSSGMQVRLLFSVATAIEPEILLLDEILSASDISFQEKVTKRMLSLIDRARLIIFASHDLALLCRLCTRVIWLDHGIIKMDGKATEVTACYQDFMMGKLPHGSAA